ncbi:MAG: hypothetical protein KF733_09535 [Fimbriimonadaceae bacterium]|nr:MAG: hypothetical protein KF733_09535 [Fimbriimonadaceae bacterium]
MLAYITLAALISVSAISTEDLRSYSALVPLRLKGFHEESFVGDEQPFSISWRRGSDDAKITLRVYDLSNGKRVSDTHWSLMIGAGVRGQKATFISGHPITGEAAFNQDSEASVHWRSQGQMVSCFMSYRRVKGQDGFTVVASDQAADRELVEGLARAVIGGLTGRTATKGVDRIVHGEKVERYEGPGGRPCLDLVEWARASRLPVNQNHASGLATIDSRVGQVVLPLGAASAKVGKNSKALQEPIFAVNGKWFVDEQFLATLD